MNNFDRVCLCDHPSCSWCQAWHREQAEKNAGKSEAVKDILRTKFKGKK